MTRKEMELQHHKTAAEHHAGLAECKKAEMSEHKDEAERLAVSDPSRAAHHKTACERCAKELGHHAALAESHLEMHKGLGELSTEEIQSHGGTSADVKALVTSVDELRKTIANGVIPTQVSAVPRFGAPDPRTRETVSKVSPELRHLVHDETEARQ